jgi:hypothetical protein
MTYVVEATGDISTHHAFTDAKSHGDLIDGCVVYPMKQERLPALGRQLRNSGGEYAYSLLASNLSLRCQFKDGKVHVRHCCDMRAAAPLAQSIDRQIRRYLE